MATKKKKSATAAEIKKKRTKAAKKGWATRRRNEAKARAKTRVYNNNRKLKNAQLATAKKTGKGKKPNPSTSLKGLNKKQLIAVARKQEQELLEKEREIERMMRTEDWVDAVDPEYLSREGHITVQPSMARHDKDYFKMRARLDEAWAIGNEEFDEVAYDLSQEYDYEIREIYTMFHSP